MRDTAPENIGKRENDQFAGGMSNPTEREWIRMRRDAEVDRRTEQKAARLEIAKGLKRDGVDPAIIAKNTGLSSSEIANL